MRWEEGIQLESPRSRCTSDFYTVMWIIIQNTLCRQSAQPVFKFSSQRGQSEVTGQASKFTLTTSLKHSPICVSKAEVHSVCVDQLLQSFLICVYFEKRYGKYSHSKQTVVLFLLQRKHKKTEIESFYYNKWMKWVAITHSFL